jgi:very-short-patch-repair endonuclease
MGIIVDWNNYEIINKPRAARANQREKHYLCRCTCGNTFRLRKSDATRSALRGSGCHQCRLERLADTFRSHQNPGEQRVESWLRELRAPYAAQCLLALNTRRYIVDFLVLNTLVVEIDGRFYHQQPPRVIRDQNLFSDWSGDVLRLDYNEIMRQPNSAKHKLRAALGMATH